MLPICRTTRKRAFSLSTKTDQTELQIYDGANPLVMKVSKFAFESGKTYRVDFGLYDVNSTDVRAVPDR